ncbi:hypothetical protein GWI33_009454, partial [Rhynchophorus ferrugineus]
SEVEFAPQLPRDNTGNWGSDATRKEIKHACEGVIGANPTSPLLRW